MNQNGTNIKEFSAPAADGKMSQSVSIAGTFESFEWTTPEGIKSAGMELDPRGSDVGLENPYNNGGGGSGSYPSFSDATNYSRCAWKWLAVPCEIQARFIASNGY